MKLRMIILIVAIFCVAAWDTSAQESIVIEEDFLRGMKDSEFDETAVWHPERIFIKWAGEVSLVTDSKTPGMQLNILLPPEEDRSGVANIFFRNRESGEVRMLDRAEENPNYGRRMAVDIGKFAIDTMKYYRQANTFEQGVGYDLIVLYNNGKYMGFPNVRLWPRESHENVHTVIMSAHQVRPADEYSRELLKMRKFTDIIGKRMVTKTKSMEPSPHKIIGYLFGSRGIALGWLGDIRLPKGDDGKHRSSSAYYDGYVELDVDSDSEVYPLEMFVGAQSFSLDAKANTWIFVVQDRVIRPATMVGSAGGD